MESDGGPVVCELQYSGAVSLALAAAAFATLSIAAMLPWSVPLRASIGLGVVALALRSRRGIRAVRSIRVDADGTVTATLRDASVAHGRLQEGCFVASWLTIVRWRPARGWFDRTILIVPPMTRHDALRRLRVRLRLG